MSLNEKMPPTPQRPIFEWKKRAFLLVAFAFVAILGIIILKQTDLAAHQEQFLTLVDQAGPWGWLVLIAIMILHAFVPFPLEFAAVAAGATYGFWLGSLLTWIGTLAGGALSFALARWLGRPFIERTLNDKKRAWLASQSQIKGALALLISRLLPFVSFTLISYAAGLTRVSWWTFLWTTGIGILPVLFIAVFYGANMSEMPMELAIAIPLAVLAVVIILYIVARKRGWINSSVH